MALYAIIRDGYVYRCGNGGRYICADLQTGNRVWSSFQPSTGTRPASWANVFTVAHDDRFSLANDLGDLITVVARCVDHPIDNSMKYVFSHAAFHLKPYSTRQVLTVHGIISQGYERRTRDSKQSGEIDIQELSTQRLLTINKEDIEEAKKTGSPMPEGLTSVISPSQLLDLIQYLSELRNIK